MTMLDLGTIQVRLKSFDSSSAMGQRSFWDEQQKVAKLKEKKPFLKVTDARTTMTDYFRFES
jgi:hypothetical protein